MLIGFQDFVASSDHGSQFDVCIAGGGVAGITLALELARSDKRVLLLEGGDIDFTDESQELYAGENVGRDYFDVDVGRLRFLGGSSNHWAGFCVPFDDFDFEARSDIEAFGWPISKADLSPWLDQASGILELDGQFLPDQPLAEVGNNLRRFETKMSTPVRFGEKYAEQLRANPNIVTVLNASVIDIRIDTVSGAIETFEVVHTNDPDQKADVTADRFVLALGGIENARALLNANKQMESGIGNDRDLVGRYFMDHIMTDLGFALLSAPFSTLFSAMSDERFGDAVSFAPTREFLRESNILNCELRVRAIERREATASSPFKSRLKQMICSSEVALNLISYVDTDFKQDRCWLAHRIKGLPAESFDAVIMARSEQAPNYDSRVSLADERDRLGLRRIDLNWQLLDVDKATLAKSVMELGRYFAKTDIGRIRVADWLLDDGREVAGVPEGERAAHGGHHIGTTRMAASPSQGVVDENCKVFGTSNLYVAGSSAFPTGGHAPPTLTIVQLTLRLADHLATLPA
ncbi:MAG: GMC oxidoreductase [Geminicoccaceae bacterium]